MDNQPSFYQTFREKNPDFASWEDDSILVDAVRKAPEKVGEWRDRYSDFRDRYDSLYGKAEEEDRGIADTIGQHVDTVGQHVRAAGAGLSQSLWSGVEGVTRLVAEYNAPNMVAKALLGDDNAFTQVNNKVRDFVASNASDIGDLANESFGVRDETTQKFTGQLAAGAGQLAGQLATSIVNPFLGIANMAGQMQNEAISDSEEVFGKKYEEFNAEEKYKADTMGVLYASVGAALERVGLHTVFGGLLKRVGGGAAKEVTKKELVEQITYGQFGKAIAKGFLGEGVTEASQGQLLDSLARMVTDDERELWGEEVWNKRLLEFTLGGILGGGAGGLSAKVENMMDLHRQETEGRPTAPIDPVDPADPADPADPQQSGERGESVASPDDLIRNAAMQRANVALSEMEQALEDGKFDREANAEVLEQYRADFPEYAERIDDLQKPVEEAPESEAPVDPTNEESETTEEPQGEKLTEPFIPDTPVEWDVKRGNEYTISKGKVVSVSTAADGKETYDIEKENGTVVKVVRDIVRERVEDNQEQDQEPDNADDAGALPDDLSKEEVIRPERVAVEPELRESVEEFALDHLEWLVRKETGEGNMRLLNEDERNKVKDDVVNTLTAVLKAPHAEGSPSLEQVLEQYQAEGSKAGQSILSAQEAWLSDPKNQKSTKKVATLEEGGAVEWTTPSGKIIKGQLLGLALKDGKETVRVFDGKSEYEFPISKVRPVNSTNAQAVKEKTITPKRKTLLPSTKKWVTDYAFNHAVYLTNRAINAQRRGEPFSQEDFKMAWGSGVGKNADKSARRTKIIKDVEKLLNLALTDPHGAPKTLAEVLAAYPVAEPGTNQEVVIAPLIERGEQVASELAAWLASDEGQVRTEKVATGGKGFKTTGEVERARKTRERNQRKEEAEAKRAVKRTLKVGRAFKDDPAAKSFADALLKKKTKAAKEFQQQVDVASKGELISLVDTLMEEAGVVREVAETPAKKKATPKAAKKPGPKKVGLLTPENARKFADVLNENPHMSVSAIMEKIKVNKKQGQPLRALAAKMGLLSPQYIDSFKGIGKIYEANVFSTVEAFHAVKGLDAFMWQQKPKKGGGGGDVRTKSRALIAILDESTGEVLVRPIVKAKDSPYTKVKELLNEKKDEYPSSQGHHAVDINKLPSGAKVLVIFEIDGDPLLHGVNFKDQAAFSEAFGDEGNVAKPRSAATSQDVKDEKGHRENSGKKASSINAEVGEGGATKADFIAAPEEVHLPNLLSDEGVTEDNKYDEDYRRFWGELDGFSEVINTIIKEAQFNIDSIRDFSTSEQKKALERFRRLAIDRLYDEAISQGYDGQGRRQPLPAGDVKSGNSNESDGGTGLDAEPIQQGPVEGNETPSVSSDSVANEGTGRKSKPDPLARGSNDAEGPDPLAATNAGKTGKPRKSKPVVQGSDGASGNVDTRGGDQSGQSVPSGVGPAPKKKAAKKASKHKLYSPAWVTNLLSGWAKHRGRMLDKYSNMNADQQEGELASYFDSQIKKGVIPSFWSGNALLEIYRDAKQTSNTMSEVGKSMGRVMKMYGDAAATQPDDFQLSLSKEPTTTNKRVTPLTQGEQVQWENTLKVLSHAGIDVDFVQRDAGSDNDFFKRQNASYSRKRQLIQVVMNDTTSPNNRNLRALLHEVAHAVVGTEAPGMIRAVDKLAIDLLEGRANITAEHLLNPEEATVELLAMRLQDEGFGSRSTSLAQAFVRYLKDLYYRVNISVQKSLFGEDAVGGTVALKYFDNRMRQFLAGDGDFLPSFLQELGGPRPTKSQILSSQEHKALGGVDEIVIGRDGQPIFPNVLPVGDAILSSGVYDSPVTAEMEAAYQKAVEARDAEAAFLLVKQAAARAGYVYEAYHGTEHGQPLEGNAFDKERRGSNTGAPSSRKAFFAAKDRSTAEAYQIDPRDELRSTLMGGLNDVGILSHQEQVDLFKMLDRSLTISNFYDKTEHGGWAKTGDYIKLIDRVVYTLLGKKKFKDIDSFIKEVGERTSSDGGKAKFDPHPDFIPTLLHYFKLREQWDPATSRYAPYHLFISSQKGVKKFDDKGEHYRDKSYNDRIEETIAEGKDLTLMENSHDSGILSRGATTVYAFQNPNQAKSADPVTYDDAGNVIPLSQRFNPQSDDIRHSSSNEQEYRPPNESRAWQHHAVWVQIETLLQNLANKTGLTRDQMAKALKLPADALENMAKIVEKVPAAKNATLDTLTPAEHDKAVQLLHRVVGKYIHKAHRLTEQSAERIKESQKLIDDELQYINDINTDPANAALLNEDIRKQLRQQFKEYRKFAQQIGDDFKLEGELEQIARESGSMDQNDPKTHDEFVRTFNQMTGDSAKPMRFAEALASLGIDFKPSATKIVDILAAMKGYRTNAEFLALSPTQQSAVAKSLDQMNGDTALRAVMVAFARGNALRMDVLSMRHLADSGKYSDIISQTRELRTASDERIKQLEQEVRETVANLTAKDRLRRDLVLHNAKLRRHRRAEARHTANKKVVDAVFPDLQLEARHWGEQLGVVQVFEGGVGSVFPVMDPVKGGGIKEHKLYQDWSDSTELFHAAGMKNKQWLELNKDLADTPTYQAVEEATNRFFLDHAQKDSQVVRRNMFTRMLQPMVKLFNEMGLAEAKIVGSSMYLYEATFKALNAKFTRPSRQWEVAYQEIVKAAGYKGLPGEFNSRVRHAVLHRLERESGLTNDQEAIDMTLSLLNTQLARVGSPQPVDQTKLQKAVGKWILAERKTSALMDGEREGLGLPIEDSATWKIDPITGRPKHEMRLKGVKQGWLTTPRSLRFSIFKEVSQTLNNLNWFGIKGESGVFSTEYWKVEGATVAEQSAIIARVSNDFAPAIANRNLRENFFDPFMQNEESVFKGFNATEVNQAWEDADGNMGLFIAHLAAGNGLDVLDVANTVISTFRNKANFFNKVAGRALSNEGAGGTTNKHFIIDSRKDSTLPAHFFEYVQFDQHSVLGYASRLASNKHFGRGGERLQANLDRLKIRLTTERDALKNKGSKSKKERSELHNVGERLAAAEKLEIKLKNYFSTADTGPYQDEKIYNELVGMLVGNVLNNPKTSITQFITPIIAPALTYKGANALTIGTSLTNIKAGLGAAAQSVLQGMGYHFDLLPEYERTIAELVGGLNESGLSLGEQMVATGKGSQFEYGFTGKGRKLLRKTRKGLDVQVGSKGAKTRIAMRGPTGVFKWVASIANYATAVGQVKMVVKVSEQVARYMDAHGEWDNPDFDIKDPKVLKAMLGSGYTLNPLFGKADTLKELAQQIEERFSMSFPDFVRKQRARKEAGKKELNYDDISSIVQIAEDELSMNAGMNSRPTWFFDNKTKPLTMLWGWPVMQTERVLRMLSDEKGNFAIQKKEGKSSLNPLNYEVDRRILLKMAVTMTMFAMPASLAYSLMLDLYDEWFRGKAPNLRKPSLSKSAGDNTLMVVERLARMGTFGMGGDIVNSVVNWNDYHGGGNPISLDDRILVMSSVHNLTNAIRNWGMQGDASYATVGRPLLNAIGGNSFLQYVQLWNEGTRKLGVESPDPGGILDKEGKFTKRSNVYNIVRAAAREAELPLNQGGGFAIPTGASMYLREMQFAALDNDNEAFSRNYREAVRAYMETKDNPRTYEEAVATVKSRWGGRHPLKTLFKGKLDASEIALLYSKMPEGNRRDVQRAVMLHEMYENLLGGGGYVPPVATRSRRSPSPVAPI